MPPMKPLYALMYPIIACCVSAPALAALGGIGDLPPVEEIFTDRFGAVTGE